MAALAVIRAGAFAALTILVFMAPPETAEAQNLPGGSWRQTCRNAQMQNDDLIAECRTSDGRWNRSRIDMDRCGRGGTLANRNGDLVCESQGGQHGGNLPAGSWRQSCRNGHMQHDDLIAECRTSDGRWRNSRIDMDRCGRSGTIANRNGELVCENQQGNNWWGQGLPPGSYRQSCRNERMVSRDDLQAECRRNNGEFRFTRLDIDRCRGRDIANINGHLECGDHRYSGNYGRYQMPGGSWQQTCRNARLERDDLHAECRQRDGDWVRSKIDLDDCRGQQVHNDNGRLRCGFGGNHGGHTLPHGSWQESCRNPRFEGNGRMVAECRQRDGDWKTDGINVPDCNGRPIYNNNGLLRC
jgi:hypothetical protein